MPKASHKQGGCLSAHPSWLWDLSRVSATHAAPAHRCQALQGDPRVPGVGRDSNRVRGAANALGVWLGKGCAGEAAL